MRKNFLSNRIILFILLIVIHSLFLLPLLPPGVPHTHDNEVNIARTAAYYQAFVDGHVPPRWAGNLNYGYGIPVLVFFYPLPGYIGSFLHMIGFSFQNAYKIILATAFVGAPVTFFLWSSLRWKPSVAFIISILYGLAPYHFLNMYVRGDIGELAGYAIAPLVFWAVEKYLHKPSLTTILTGSIFYGLLVLAHNVVSLLFSPIILGYALWKYHQNHKSFALVFFMLALGLGMSAFFWMPSLFELRYTNSTFFFGSIYREHFPSLIKLVYAAWGFGPDVNKVGGLSPQLGPLLTLLTVLGMVSAWRTHKVKNLHAFWTIVFFVSLFLVLPISAPIWQQLSLLKKFPFPWRFVGVTTFAGVLLAGFFFEKIKSRYVIFIFTLLAIVLSVTMARVQGYLNVPDSYYQNYPATTDYHGATSTIWTAGFASSFPKQPIEIISGTATISDYTRTTTRHAFTVHAQSQTTVLDNTFYYIGWKTSIDGKNVPIEFQDPNHRGLITFIVPPGEHSVTVAFTETKVRMLANAISLLFLGFVIVLFGMSLRSRPWREWQSLK
ncbi:MAG: hypothetical protein UY16_C0001G0014 [Candidatus Gottesmanbacteria bacterium GW2011_GWA2_47_9]|uniref:Membrane protein 6-pyruvoyl-tetrahydropterin synthase-related domain-containing protein n=2 Tax=Microgenomates group TaxID=1794810 RepID=A0A0G1X361_9BACT|nr:MAG: hypothetical protein UV66_C0006G0004 [Candidatus Woesebacteria bacterium GW2011_GWA1_43_12]KKU88860.1 MAG: hypothetical protein UY16_C0001G0014 [Candidatus Gottesmanbacteria bacterium GW2011_GWA2_47_9]